MTEQEEQSAKSSPVALVKSVCMSLLQDEEVRQAFCAFMQATGFQVSQAIPKIEAKDSTRVDELTQELKTTQERLHDEEAQHHQVANDLQSLRAEKELLDQNYRNLEQDYSDLNLAKNRLQLEKDSLKDELGNFQYRYEDLSAHYKEECATRQRVEADKRALKEQLATLQRDFQALQNDQNALVSALEREKTQRARMEEENRKLRVQREKLQRDWAQSQEDLEQEKGARARADKKLAQSFPEMWEAFAGYKKYREDIGTVFHDADSFESFICNCAQSGVLSLLWDDWRMSQYEGDSAREEVMRLLFRHCFRLVNFTRKAGEQYQFLRTTVGDEQDNSTQTYARESGVQGNVREVLIPGYINTYNKKVEKKSLVILG